VDDTTVFNITTVIINLVIAFLAHFKTITKLFQRKASINYYGPISYIWGYSVANNSILSHEFVPVRIMNNTDKAMTVSNIALVDISVKQRFT
jgi:hypothetical protein